MSVDDPNGSVQAPDSDTSGLTRREALRRGVAFSGLIWVPPVVTSMQLVPGTAQDTSPPPSTTTTSTSSTTTSTSTTTTTIPVEGDISFIGFQVSCGDGVAAMGYALKYEGCVGDECFESDPGKFPDCEGFMVSGDKADGDDLGFTVEGPNEANCVTVHVPEGCFVSASIVKYGSGSQSTGCCQPGPTGSGAVLVCPPTC